MLYGSLEGGLGSQPDLFQASEKASRVEDLINLRRIVPKQKIAPVQFDIVNNIIVVQSTESNIPSDIRRATNAAREELLSRGHDLIEQLKRSNCDRRLLESAAELHTHLQNGKDVVRLGLANIGFSLMGGKFQNELPEAIAALVQAHSVGVSMYVAQFPDWAKFAENASAIEVDKKDAATLSQVLTQVISATEDKKVAEPEVPRTLKHLRSLISDPKAFSARLALAVIRTIENLTIRLFNHGSDFFEKTISQSIDLGAKTTSRVIVGALLAVGMTAAVGLTPMVPKVHGLNWIDDALQIVQRQLSSLKD